MLFICFSVGTKNGTISLDETNESNNGRNVHKVDHEEFTSFADQFAFRS